MASALAVLQDRDAALRAREEFLVAAAESLPSPDAVLAALNESAKERAEIGAERDSLSAQMSAEVARRSRIANAPAIAADEIAVAAQAAAKADDESPKPFRTFGQQLVAIADASIAMKQGRAPDPRIAAIMDWEKTQAAVAGASTVVGSDGGFLVQTDFASGLVADVFSASVLGAKAQKRQIGANANGVTWNQVDESSRASTRYGGVVAYWVAEGGSITASRPKVQEQELKLAKLTGLYVATSELLGDSTALESFARPAFTSEFAFQVDDKMIRGTGAGVPLGILNADCLVSVTKETGQVASTVNYENIKKMFIRMRPSSRTSAEWYINNEVYPQLWSLEQVIGVGGVPVFLPPGGASGSPYGTLMGRPIVDIEHASALGTVGDIAFADFNEYLLIQKGGIEEASSIHVYFDTDQQVFRWILRTNGRPVRTSSLTPYKGSLTTSPFVVLQTRS